MLTACCKLAKERTRQAYVVGLSHGPLPDPPRAQATVATCLQLHGARYWADEYEEAVRHGLPTTTQGKIFKPGVFTAVGNQAGREWARTRATSSQLERLAWFQFRGHRALINLARYEETRRWGCKHPDGSRWKKAGV